MLARIVRTVLRFPVRRQMHTQGRCSTRLWSHPDLIGAAIAGPSVRRAEFPAGVLGAG